MRMLYVTYLIQGGTVSITRHQQRVKFVKEKECNLLRPIGECISTLESRVD